jgi:hypothetical protein
VLPLESLRPVLRCSTISRLLIAQHVLVLRTERLHFYFRKRANIINVGDYFGPARYQDLFHELYDGDGCPPYVNRLDISAVIMPPFQEQYRWEWFYQKFGTRLRQCGYKEYRCGEKNGVIFLRSDINLASGSISYWSSCHLLLSMFVCPVL